MTTSLPEPLPEPKPSETISLNDTAERLGVHYMTAYRYVRTGQLPAVKSGGEWRVLASDVESFRTGPKPPATTGRRQAGYHKRLEDRLVAGDETGAWAVIESALSAGVEPSEVYLDVLAPALAQIGADWAAGRATIAQEHRATAVTIRLIGRLGPRFNRPGKKRGTVIIGAPSGDQHSVPAAIASDLLRGQGFDVLDLGANTPAMSFVDAALHADRLVAVGISATADPDIEAIRGTIDLVHSELGCPVVLGGRALADIPDPESLGAEFLTWSSTSMMQAFDSLAESRIRQIS
jgi:excisionase family DNA binding protein